MPIFSIQEALEKVRFGNNLNPELKYLWSIAKLMLKMLGYILNILVSQGCPVFPMLLSLPWKCSQQAFSAYYKDYNADDTTLFQRNETDFREILT